METVKSWITPMDSHEPAKLVIDFASISTVIATIAGWLPNLAAAVSIIWGLIRIYETQTVQGLISKWRHREP